MLCERCSGLRLCCDDWLQFKDSSPTDSSGFSSFTLSGPRRAPAPADWPPLAFAGAGAESAGAGKLSPKGTALSAIICTTQINTVCSPSAMTLDAGVVHGSLTFYPLHIQLTSNGDLNADMASEAGAAACCAAAAGCSAEL